MIPRRSLFLLLVPIGLVLIGTVGYYVLEPAYSLFDALYMTVITLTTVGYGEVHALSTQGRAFTIVLLLVGVFTFFYAAGELLRSMISGEMQAHLEKQRMERSLAELTHHAIICGYGRMGRHVCQEFSKKKQPFVLIDRKQEALEGFNFPYGIAIAGDASSDEVLKRAGVERADALVTVAASDADNLFITMSARLLNADLTIVARAENEHAEVKLRRAGATRVIAPYAIGGLKMAQAVLRPNVVDFIELATKTEHLELQIEEAIVSSASVLVGTTVSASRLRQDLGIIIVAIKKTSGEMVYTPSSEARLEAGDTLIALGRRDQLDQFEERASAKK